MEKVWLKNYEPGVPSEIGELKYNSLPEYIEAACKKYTNNTSFINFGTGISYAKLLDLSDRFAYYLRHELNLKKNDRVAIMLPNLLQYPVVLFGILRAGLIVVNVNPLYTAAELSYQLKDSGTQTIVVLANFIETVTKVKSECQLKHIIVTEVGDLLGNFKGPFINAYLRYIKGMVPKYSKNQFISLKSALKRGARYFNQHMPVIALSDIAFLQYTGGTTGVSKAAILTHQNILSNIEQSYHWINGIAEEGKEVLVTPLPMYHIFSLTVNCLIFLGNGSQNIMITNPRDIKGFIRAIKHKKITSITGVNTLFNALINNPSFREIDFSHFKMALGGGMAIQESVARKWEQLTGRPLLVAYGLTETSPAALMNPMNTKSYSGNVGVPIPSTDMKICDDAGREIPYGEPGEIYLKGPQVMNGYWNRPEETAEALVDGWLRTGDIATMDQDGFVTIVDRKKDMILVSGFNVYPNQIEEVLVACSGVREVGVIGEKLDDARELVVAYVVRSDQNVTETMILDHARKSLTAYKVPKKIIFIDELPKTNVGKISRKDLKILHQAC